MITIRERQGDTLVGAIDGINTNYFTSYSFYDDLNVHIYVNGRLKIREWDDGFSVVMPNQVVLKEPLLPDDSLEVEYFSGVPTGGGADGGCPSRPEVVIVKPGVQTEETLPEMSTDVIEPIGFTETPQAGVLLDELKPVIFSVEEG